MRPQGQEAPRGVGVVVTASNYVTLWCDQGPTDDDPYPCLEWYGGHTATAKDTRRDARVHGWAVALPGGRDLCPLHTRARAVEADQPANA